jgi:hypothetical protein
LQYKVQLPAAFAGICSGGGACPNATPPTIKTVQTRNSQ